MDYVSKGVLKMQNPSEGIRYDNIVTPQNAGGGAVNTNAAMYRSMAKYRKGFMIVTATLTDTKTAIAQLTESTAASATSKGNVAGKTCTLTGAAGTTLNQIGAISFDVSDLSADHLFVGCDVTTNQGGDCVSVVLCRMAPRYEMGGPAATTGANANPV
jgi:hypothetical protein